MSTTFDPHALKHASVFAKDRFFCVESCAGYRSFGSERIAAFLPGDAPDDDVGRAVLEALASYRVLSVAEVAEFRDLGSVEARHSEWERQLMELAGYTSRQEIYRGLKHVPVRLSGSELSVSATVQDRRHGFEGNGFALTMAVNIGAAAVGAAVKSAVSECA